MARYKNYVEEKTTVQIWLHATFAVCNVVVNTRSAIETVVVAMPMVTRLTHIPSFTPWKENINKLFINYVNRQILFMMMNDDEWWCIFWIAIELQELLINDK